MSTRKGRSLFSKTRMRDRKAATRESLLAQDIRGFQRALNWFVEGTEASGEPILAGGKCQSCGKVIFPRKMSCPNCLTSGRMSVFPLNRRARLLGYGVANRGSMYLALPYAFGYVALPEGLKVYSMFVECEPYETKLRTGMTMEVVSVNMANAVTGVKNRGYAFRPVTNGK